MQLDVMLQGAPFRPSASFYNAGGTKHGPPETAYKPDLESLREHLGTQNLLLNPSNPMQAVNDLLSVMTNAEICNHSPSRGKTGRDPGSSAGPEPGGAHAFKTGAMNATAKLPDIQRP